MTGLRRALAAALCLPVLAACTVEEVGAPPGAVAAAAYVSPEPVSLTLVTVLENGTGDGAHTALMVNASQRVVFDPAGTFNEPVNNPANRAGGEARVMVERGDVLYGMSPAYYDAYVDYHTRETFRTVEQTVVVSPEAAEAALALVRASGPASKATCALATSRILAQVPGFEGFPVGWYPRRAMEAFAARPGVRTVVHRDDDPDANADKRAAAVPGL